MNAREEWSKRVAAAIDASEPLYVTDEELRWLARWTAPTEPAPAPRPGEWVSTQDMFGGIPVVADAAKADARRESALGDPGEVKEPQ